MTEQLVVGQTREVGANAGVYENLWLPRNTRPAATIVLWPNQVEIEGVNGPISIQAVSHASDASNIHFVLAAVEHLGAPVAFVACGSNAAGSTPSSRLIAVPSSTLETVPHDNGTRIPFLKIRRDFPRQSSGVVNGYDDKGVLEILHNEAEQVQNCFRAMKDRKFRQAA